MTSKTVAPMAMATAIAKPPTSVSSGYFTSIRTPSRDVERDAIDPLPAAGVAAFFLVLLDAAEGDIRLAARFESIEATLSHQPFGLHLDVKAHLLVHVGVESGAAGDSPPGRVKACQQLAHDYSSCVVACSAVAMACAKRFQPAASSRSRFRPAVVSW